MPVKTTVSNLPKMEPFGPEQGGSSLRVAKPFTPLVPESLAPKHMLLVQRKSLQDSNGIRSTLVWFYDMQVATDPFE